MPYVTVNDKDLFYTTSHPVEAIPQIKSIVVFVHGLGSSSCFYQTIIPNLSSEHCAVALDTYGSGLSKLNSSSAAAQTIDTIVADVFALLDALKIQEQIVIVGHSMGGIVASALAAAHPRRVKGVVLIGPVNPSNAMADVFEKRIQVVQNDGLEVLAGSVPTAATGSASSSLHHAFIRALILGTTPEGYASLCKVIATAEQPRYEAITAPVLLLAGEDDNTAPMAGSKAILDAYGTKSEEKTLEVLQGVGHWHCVEDPVNVTAHLGTFLNKILK